MNISGNLTLVFNNGKVACFGSTDSCLSHSVGGHILNLSNGHVTPGLIAAASGLGMSEIAMEAQTGDGSTDASLEALESQNIVYAKYGVHLEGKLFERAKIGGR